MQTPAFARGLQRVEVAPGSRRQLGFVRGPPARWSRKGCPGISLASDSCCSSCAPFLTSLFGGARTPLAACGASVLARSARGVLTHSLLIHHIASPWSPSPCLGLRFAFAQAVGRLTRAKAGYVVPALALAGRLRGESRHFRSCWAHFYRLANGYRCVVLRGSALRVRFKAGVRNCAPTECARRALPAAKPAAARGRSAGAGRTSHSSGEAVRASARR